MVFENKKKKKTSSRYILLGNTALNQFHDKTIFRLENGHVGEKKTTRAHVLETARAAHSLGRLQQRMVGADHPAQV